MNNENKENNINTTAEEKISPEKKKDLIKTVLIVFLTVLLLLTFFSNTIMNRSLPEISTETAGSGKLTERIRGSGLVEANQVYEVKADGNCIIQSVEVKTGKEVKKGDLLFTINAVDNETLELEEKSLSELELAYQKALLTAPVDYTKEDQAIRNAREDLNRAIAARNEAASKESSAAAAKGDYDNDKRELITKTTEKENISSVISAIDIDDYSEASPEYSGQLPSLLNRYMEASGKAAEAAAEYKKITDAGNEDETAKAAVDSANAELESAKNDYMSEKNNVRSSLLERLGSLESEMGDISFRISEYETMYGSAAGASSYEAADEAVTLKQRALQDLLTEYNATKISDDLTAQKDALDLDAQQKAIEKQREKIEKMKKEAEVTEIKSKYDGVISAINVKADEKVMDEAVLAVIDISGEGYKVKFAVDAEKVKKVSKGTKAEVVNNWGGDIEAVLTDIKNDTVSGSKNRILEFSLTGDVDPGTNIDISIPCGSGQYDAIVPKSAVTQDNNGDFVMTVESKSSPLGNRYYAQRVDVNVKASDEKSSAVEGDISRGTYVITASSKPIKPGDQVRIKDN